jgi:hypothetical protein
VLVAPEEHERTRVVELVHGVEVWDLLIVAHVDDDELLDLVDDLVEVLVHLHALVVRVAPEADADYAAFFGGDGLVDVPAYLPSPLAIVEVLRFDEVSETCLSADAGALLNPWLFAVGLDSTRLCGRIRGFHKAAVAVLGSS